MCKLCAVYVKNYNYFLGESTILATPKEYTLYEYMRWLGFNSQTFDVKFKVKACADANVFLTADMGIAIRGYRVTLG